MVLQRHTHPCVEVMVSMSQLQLYDQPTDTASLGADNPSPKPYSFLSRKVRGGGPLSVHMHELERRSEGGDRSVLPDGWRKSCQPGQWAKRVTLTPLADLDLT